VTDQPTADKMPPVSRLQSSLLSIVLVALLAWAAHVDVWLVAAAVVLVQLLVGAAPRLADAKGRSISTPRMVPTLVAAAIATTLAMFPDAIGGAAGTADAFDATDTGSMAGTMPAIAVAVFVTAVTQMLRKDGRRELTAAAAYALTLSTVAALATGWIGAAQSLGSHVTVIIAAAGLAAGLLVWSLPGDQYIVGGLSIVAGGAAGAAVPFVVDTFVTAVFGVAVGAATALFAVLGQVLGRALISGRRHASAGWGFPAAMSVALAAPVVFVGGQLVGTSLF